MSESGTENSEDSSYCDSQSSSDSASISSGTDSESLGIAPYNFEPSNSELSAEEQDSLEYSSSVSEADRLSRYAIKLLA